MVTGSGGDRTVDRAPPVEGDPGGSRLAAAVPFPPLGTVGLCALAVGDVRDDPTFALLAAALAALGPIPPVPDRSDGPVGVDGAAAAVAAHAEWFAAAIRSANDARYHFELTGIAGGSLAPRRCDGPGLQALLAGRPLAGLGRGTAKLVALLGVGGTGAVTLTAPGVSDPVALRAGTLVVGPAFLALSVASAPAGGADSGAGSGADVEALVVVVEGPAFR